MKRRIKIWIPAVLLVIIIFILSSDTGERSHRLSMSYANQIIAILNGLINRKGSCIQDISVTAVLDHIIRKIGHMIEYALLAVAVIVPLQKYHMRGWKSVLVSMELCLIYACMDEFHQRFIRGRDGKMTDILVDGVGSIIGITVFLIFHYNTRKRQNKLDTN